jgi:hypothetical protein
MHFRAVNVDNSLFVGKLKTQIGTVIRPCSINPGSCNYFHGATNAESERTAKSFCYLFLLVVQASLAGLRISFLLFSNHAPLGPSHVAFVVIVVEDRSHILP